MSGTNAQSAETPMPDQLDQLPDGEAMSLFLHMVFGTKPANAHLLIWSINDKQRKTSASFTNIDDAVRYALQIAPTEDVYFGLGAGDYAVKRTQRYTIEQVAGIPGLWADIDIYDPAAHKKGNLPPTIDAALALLDELELSPTLVVSSGHGLHAYWLLNQFWWFADDVLQQTQARQLEASWIYAFKLRAGEHGWDVDATQDLARVLRVPGTLNHKNREQPLPVQILKYNPLALYTLADIERVLAGGAQDLLAHKPIILSPEAQQAAQNMQLVINPDAVPPVAKWKRLQKTNSNALKSFEHQRDDLQDQTPSTYDFSLAVMAVGASVEFPEDRWTDQDICNLLIAHRRMSCPEDARKLVRADYYRTTIARARQVRQTENTIEETVAWVDTQQETPAPAASASPLAAAAVSPANTINDTNDDALWDAEFGGVPGKKPTKTKAKVTTPAATLQQAVADAETERQELAAQVATDQQYDTDDDDDDDDEDDDLNPDAILNNVRVLPTAKQPQVAPPVTPWSYSPDEVLSEFGRSQKLNDEGRVHVLDQVSASLGLTILRVTRLLASPPIFNIIVQLSADDAPIKVPLGDVDSILQGRLFRKAVAAQTTVTLPQYKAPMWNKVAKLLLAASVDEALSEEATEGGQMKAWLRDFCRRRTIRGIGNEALDDEAVEEIRHRDAPFVYDGLLCISGAALLGFLKTECQERTMTHIKLGAALRSIGAIQTTIPLVVNGQKTSRSAWKITRALSDELIALKNDVPLFD